jgi:hypothetical protein
VQQVAECGVPKAERLVRSGRGRHRRLHATGDRMRGETPMLFTSRIPRCGIRATVLLASCSKASSLPALRQWGIAAFARAGIHRLPGGHRAFRRSYKRQGF